MRTCESDHGPMVVNFITPVDLFKSTHWSLMTCEEFENPNPLSLVCTAAINMEIVYGFIIATICYNMTVN